jgi:PAS domain S-box-containing protein
MQLNSLLKIMLVTLSILILLDAAALSYGYVTLAVEDQPLLRWVAAQGGVYLGLLLLLWRVLVRAERKSLQPSPMPKQARDTLLEQFPEATLICDPTTFTVLTANAAALSALHLRQVQQHPQTLPQLVPSPLWPPWQQFLAAALTSPGVSRGDSLPWQASDGPVLQFQASASRVDYAGQSQLLLVLRDVTLAARMQRRLQAQEECLRLVLAAAGLTWVDWDITADVCRLDGNIQSLLPSMNSAASWHTLWPQIVATEAQQGYAAALAQHLRGESVVFEQEFRLLGSESSACWLRQVGQVLGYQQDGTPARMLSVFQDISTQKQNEHTQHLSAVIFESQQASLVLDNHWRVQLVNTAARDMSGYDEAALTGTAVLPYIVKLAEAPRTVLRRLHQTGQWQGEVVARLAAGKFSLWGVVNTVRDETQAKRYVVQLIDMTGQRQLQEYSQRLSNSQSFARHLLAAQEAERKFLARELHDALGQYLVGIRLYAGLISEASGSEELAGFATEIERAADAIHQVVRRINRRLLPADLEAIGLLGGLRNLVTQLGKYKELQAEFSLIPPDATVTLEEMVALSCYRVVQESLNNVVKHAQARQVKVVVRVDVTSPHPHLAIAVQDDGMGMDLSGGECVGKGVGLLSMRERVEALGGEFTLSSVPGLGTHLTLQFPLPLMEHTDADADGTAAGRG